MERRRRLLLLLGGSVVPRTGPSALTGSIDAGGEDGEIDFTVDALPSSWGDSVVAGDGLAGPDVLQWWSIITGWQTLVDPADTGEVTVEVDPSQWGTVQTFKMRALSDAGLYGPAIVASITVPGALQELVAFDDGAGSVYDFGGAILTTYQEVA